MSKTAAPSLVDLLGTCPGLNILVTSRAVLRVQREYESAVPPLALPALKYPPDAEAVSHSAAVALFVQRAQASRPGFHLTDANAPVIVEILYAWMDCHWSSSWRRLASNC